MNPGNRCFLWGVRLAALWVLAGSLAKSFTGLPGDLPSPVLQLDVDPLFILALAVAVESFIAFCALRWPRRGAVPLALLLALFEWVLILHARSGAESCGCFGGALPIPASVMIAIDGVLLLVTLAGAVRLPRLAPVTRGALTLAAIALVSTTLALAASSRLSAYQPREAAKSPTTPRAHTLTPAIVPALPPSPPAPWALPAEFPAQVLLRPLQWIGKPLAETELGRWTDTAVFPSDCTLLIYYLSCNHCAAHLKELAQAQAANPSASPSYVLVQLPTPAGYTGRLFVHDVPTGLRVELPSKVKAWVITPPWDVVVSGARVVRAHSVPRGGAEK